ncbi:glycosyltransferase [Butyrivibrio sp. WCD2001]|uniref:glycosyltransferase n=1 Tax=Butyrivibrio sp. WCD2001 TaxID=1280681 RepID=UPI000413AB60|nr:glycosyltransferase [Butyrivibrio sp. WCD2001]
MDRIAIISPCILPVPAKLGGAVEGLITQIIEDNEKNKACKIDLYCIDDHSECEQDYKYTEFFRINKHAVTSIVDKFSDAFYRRIPTAGSKRILDKEILKVFAKRVNEIRGEYDAIIIENLMSTANEIVKYCKGRFEIPIYFHMHNCVDVYRSPKYISELVKNGVQFIAVSEYIKEEILSNDRNALVHVLYNGVKITDCQKKEDKKDVANLFLYSGRIIPEKGVKELVIAFGKFIEELDKSQKEQYRLDIIGFSKEKTRYEKQVLDISQKYEGNIKCIGMLSPEEILRKYYEYDAVIMPTKNMEPFGLVALETISRGIPLITTNSGAIPEIVGDGAVIIDKDHDFIDNIKNAISRASFDSDYRKAVADKGYIRARSTDKYNISFYYNNFIKIVSGNSFNEIISVIVPVYNVEEYIDRCVESITNQTYSRLEIILVDDGSTDSSGQICGRYAQMDDRIQVIHQQNQGLSAARNTGLECMSGDVVFFCDSDDYLQSNTLEKMLDKMNRDHADIVACGIKMFGEKEDLFTSAACGLWSGHEAVIQMMRTNNICTVAWNKLYKKYLFESVRFPVGALHEDEATTYKLVYNAKIVSFTPVPYYNYLQRSSGIMGENISHRSNFYIEALQERVKYFYGNEDSELTQHSLISLLDGIKYIYRNTENIDFRKKLINLYRENITCWGIPKVMGIRKAMSLFLWNYIRY